jgi:catalase
MVPGIEPSADPVLQSRLFSYPDAHRHRIGVNYQQLPVNAPRNNFRIGNFQRDGQMAFFNQGNRPAYLSSIEPMRFRERTVDLDKVHGYFTGQAVTFLSEIRPEDFNAPRNLWENVFDDGAKERFVKNVSGHMATCREKEAIKRQLAIFREVSKDLATRLEKATGIKGYDGIASLRFNGTHNGMAKDDSLRLANDMKGVSLSSQKSNGAPVKGSHLRVDDVKNGALHETNGSKGANGLRQRDESAK